MAAKKKIINIKVYFDGDQDAKDVNCNLRFHTHTSD